MNNSSEEIVISVFGSHAPQPGSLDYALAYETGKLLATNRFSVATGGYGGTMAGVSQGAAEAGGHVIGVTSKNVAKSRPVRLNQWVKEEVSYNTLADRVLHLVLENSGMIVLPGGIGTLSEFALAWSLMQVKEISPRPLILVGKFWTETFRVFVDPAYVEDRHRRLITVVDTPKQAVDSLMEILPT